MLSKPPETMTSLLPASSRSWLSMVAFMPEPQSLLIVVAPADFGMPAWIAAWRAGPCRWPCGSTQPRITSSTSSAATPALSSAPVIARVPSSGPVASFSTPWKLPIGVRAMPTMTTGSAFMTHSFVAVQHKS